MNSHLKVHFGLGRAYDLPTIWSNCFAAWALTGGAFVPTLGFVLLSFTLFYVGGHYLNDACDAEFDAQYHPERPIPARLIGRTTVFTLGILFLGAGLGVISGEGWRAFGMGAAIVAGIVFFDLQHLRLGWSPLILAGCRAMIYLTVWVAATTRPNALLIIWALALGGYTVGQAYAFKLEETKVLRRYAPLLLLFLPPILNSYQNLTPVRSLLSLVYLIWFGFCLANLFWPRGGRLRLAASSMMAGICLLDLLAVSQLTRPLLWQLLCVGCFALTLALRRWARPA